MKKYYIGLIVLGIITLGLAGYIISKGISGKQDKQTHTRANEIASDLTDYVFAKDEIPADLAAAGIKDVPSTVTYTKKDATSYEFCVEYKTAKTSVFSDATSALTGAAFGGLSGYGSSFSSDASSTTSTYLYIPTSHAAGKNCQTITPNIGNTYLDSGSSSDSLESFDSSAYDQYCEPTNDYYEFYKSYCKDGKFQMDLLYGGTDTTLTN
jgi:hypothetical protein